MLIILLLIIINMIDKVDAFTNNDTVPIIIISITSPLIIAILLLIFYIMRLEEKLIDTIYRNKSYTYNPVYANGLNNPIYEEHYINSNV